MNLPLLEGTFERLRGERFVTDDAQLADGESVWSFEAPIAVDTDDGLRRAKRTAMAPPVAWPSRAFVKHNDSLLFWN
jgi:hypothetical protein